MKKLRTLGGMIREPKSLMRSSVWLMLMLTIITHASLIVLPDIRFWMHSNDYMSNRLESLSKDNVEFNHQFPGLSCESDDLNVNSTPKGFKLLRRRVSIGNGKNDYKLASKLMFNFDMINNLSWAKFITLKDNNNMNINGYDKNKKGDLVATEVKCYNLFWSFNPSRIICSHRDKKIHVDFNVNAKTKNNKNEKLVKISQIAYSTVQGHLIAGEERFRVIHDLNDDQVYFEALSFTKGAGSLGPIVMFFVRPLQNQFFSSVSTEMKYLTALGDSTE